MTSKTGIVIVRVLLFLHSYSPLPSTAQTPTDVMRAIADVEKHLPWFWTPWPEGIRDVPYAYEYELRKRNLNSKGKEEFPPRLKDGHFKQTRSLHLEHTPTEGGWGWVTRCISQDGLACGPGEFDVPPGKDPAKLSQAREKRRQQRIAMWDEFLRAFRFELRESDHVHFAPTGTYKHGGVRSAEIFEKIEGDLWFDLQTHEISRMEFELKDDIGNLLGKLYKGSHFSIELTNAIDNHYLPAAWSLRMDQRMLTSKGAEETEVRYFNYRKFGSTVTLVFGDVEVHGQ